MTSLPYLLTGLKTSTKFISNKRNEWTSTAQQVLLDFWNAFN